MGGKKKKFLLILLVLFVILFILGGISFLKGNKEKKKEYTTLDDFMALHMNMSEIDDEADEDGDGLVNKKEKERGTCLYSVDSDKDGLDDKTEVEHTKTDPLCADSDEDGILDGTEISTKLDPLNEKTDGQAKDSDRIFEIMFELEECTLTVKGKADVYGIYASSLDYCNVDNTPGVISGLYEFYMDEDKEFDSAVLEFAYNPRKLEKQGYKEENLSIFQFKNDGTFERVKSEAEDGKVHARLEHFSKYVLGDISVLGQDTKSEVFLLLDN